MTRSLADIQAELPRHVPLYRYRPQRAAFHWRGWDPATVRNVSDLPPYLILGNLDHCSFELSSDGWSARWQGTEHNTHLDVAYKAREQRWEVRQTWCGLDGGFSVYSSRIGLDRVIGEALYMKFPALWDKQAKAQIEAAYQLTFICEPEGVLTFFGIPDGAFRTIIFPIAARNLRIIRQWVKDIAEGTPLSYPVSIEVKRIFQEINYVEGKAPDWTTRRDVLFRHSLQESGLAPLCLPDREVADDGSAAWTLRRDIYFAFVTLPFAGLTDFLQRLASDYGPIRPVADPQVRFTFQPVVIPGLVETLVEGVALWNPQQSTRYQLFFAAPDEEVTALAVQEGAAAEATVLATLDKIESTSAMIREELDKIFHDILEAGNEHAEPNSTGNSQ